MSQENESPDTFRRYMVSCVLAVLLLAYAIVALLHTATWEVASGMVAVLLALVLFSYARSLRLRRHGVRERLTPFS